MPGISKVAGPLHALTEKGVLFVSTKECQNALDRLKTLLTSAPLLKYPNFTKPFILETDASGDGLGALLAQRQEDGPLLLPAELCRNTKITMVLLSWRDLVSSGLLTVFVRTYMDIHVRCPLITRR